MQIPSMISSKTKQGIILFETILSIALFFILLAGTSEVFFKLQEKTQRANYQSVALLKLEATKQFLTNNKNFHNLTFSNDELFYQENLLLNDISSYSLSMNKNVAEINICIDQEKVCTKWKIKI